MLRSRLTSEIESPFLSQLAPFTMVMSEVPIQTSTGKKENKLAKANAIWGRAPPPSKKPKSSTHAASASHSDAVESAAPPSVVDPVAVDGGSAPLHASVSVEDMGASPLLAPMASSTAAASASTVKADEGCALVHADITAQIRGRAHTVSENREWTAIFDLVVYAFMRKRRVLCCFGAQVVDLVKLFAPWLEPCLDNAQRTARFLGFVASGGQ